MGKMKKQDIISKYKKLVREIEKMKMYDGRGTIDEYICDKCGNSTYTTYRDKGVTPFVMRCNKCGGDSVHRNTFPSITFDSISTIVEIKEWYRPSLEETLKMKEGMIDHILNGGLVLSK